MGTLSSLPKEQEALCVVRLKKVLRKLDIRDEEAFDELLEEELPNAIVSIFLDFGIGETRGETEEQIDYQNKLLRIAYERS